MGMSGSGKSSFINQFHTNRPVRIGHGLASCKTYVALWKLYYLMINIGTNKVEIYQCRDDEFGNFWLMDTPGFYNTSRSAIEVLGEIIAWLNRLYLEKVQLTGILYVHSIRETRIGTKAEHSLQLFNKLCGTNALRKVVLVSTFWDTIDPLEGDIREQELKENPHLWDDILKYGSRVFRHYNHLTAKAVIRQLFLDIKEIDDRGTYLRIQCEMVDEYRRLAHTDAGQVLAKILMYQRLVSEHKLTRLQAELQEPHAQRHPEHSKHLEELRRDTEEGQRRHAEDAIYMEADSEGLMRLVWKRGALEAVEEQRKEEKKT